VSVFLEYTNANRAKVYEMLRLLQMRSACMSTVGETTKSECELVAWLRGYAQFLGAKDRPSLRVPEVETPQKAVRVRVRSPIHIGVPGGDEQWPPVQKKRQPLAKVPRHVVDGCLHQFQEMYAGPPAIDYGVHARPVKDTWINPADKRGEWAVEFLRYKSWIYGGHTNWGVWDKWRCDFNMAQVVAQ